MANHQSAIKRNKQNVKRRMRNRHFRTMMRSQIKKVNQAIESGDLEAAQASLPKAVSVIQRVSGKGVIHSRQASRRVSRLTQQIVALAAAKA